MRFDFVKGLFPAHIHRHIFLIGIIILAVGIPLSRFLVSVSQLVLLGNWFLSGNWNGKWKNMKQSRFMWVLISVYFMHLIGLVWSSDFDYALQDLRIKLPLLWLPVLFASSAPLEKKEVRIVLSGFIIAVLIASMWSMIVYSGITKIKISDIRDISRFESHIRFSLMIVLSILILISGLIKPKLLYQKIMLGIVAVWLIVFLVILQSLTGIIVLSSCTFILILIYFRKKGGRLVSIGLGLMLLPGGIGSVIFIKKEWNHFQSYNKDELSNLPFQTIAGRYYYNDTSYLAAENGHLIMIGVCDEELRKEWNRRSKISFDSTDKKSNLVRFTLIRYMASMGLRKDSTGVAKLSPQDISNIENGYSNYLYAYEGGIRNRLRQVFWEINAWHLNQNPSGHSIPMRLEFWKTGSEIISRNPIIGVGTGDVKQAFQQQYKINQTKLSERWQLRSHNQYMAITIAFGFLGLLWFLIAFWYPLFYAAKRSTIYIVFIFMIALSFINEDTLETQAGVTFYAFFNCLFLFSNFTSSDLDENT